MDGELVRAGFERKFRVPEDRAEALLTRLRALLTPDPLARPSGLYRVSSLYLDTPDRAAYRRELGGKWRLRRYGESDQVFAEYKAKPEPGQVHKRRSVLPVDDCARLPRLAQPGWFVRAIHKENLAPTCRIAYRRHAFVGALDGQQVRLTLDHDLRAAACDRFEAPGGVDDGFALTDGRILEVKFEADLPDALAELAADLGLAPESFSKYRTAMGLLEG